MRVAEAEMLGALRLMTVERGIDPRGFVLMPFGGAGPLHAAAMAGELGIERILCPRASGVLCALGLAAAAPPRRDVSRTVMLRGDSLAGERLSRERDGLIAEACAALAVAPSRVRVRYELRYRGQSFELPVEEEIEPARLRIVEPAPPRGSSPAHERRYGYRDDPGGGRAGEHPRLGRSGAHPRPSPAPAMARPGRARNAASVTHTILFDGEPLDAAVFRGELPPGTRVRGPALCLPGPDPAGPAGWPGHEADAAPSQTGQAGRRPAGHRSGEAVPLHRDRGPGAPRS